MRVAPAAVASLVWLAAAASAGPVAQPTPRPGAIVFASTRIVNHDTADVFVADARGRRVNLTQTANLTEAASDLSPDGREVVLRRTFGVADHDLFLLALSSRRLTRLTSTPTEPEHSATFSPAGDAVAFVRGHQPSREDLWVLERGGGERRLTFNGTDKSAVAWSPDGRQLAFVQRDEILVVDRAGGSPRSLAKFTVSLAKPPLVWRDDGILIPFEIANAGYGLRRISATGEVSEVRNPCGGSLPVWSDDHSHVVCWSPLRPRVVVVRTVAGRRVRPVALYPTSQSTSVGVAGLGAKGAPVVFNATVEERDADLWLLAGKLRKLTTGPGEDFDPSWSSDRRHLVFVRGAQRSRTTGRLMLFDLARRRIRPLRPRLSGRDPDWSPDGRRVVYSRNGDLWVIRVAAGRPVRLTRGRPEDIDPTWSHDGRTIAFVRHGRATELSTLPARGGPRSVLVSRQGDLLDPDWSRDDRLLAFSTLEAISLIDAAAPHRVRTIARDLDNRLTSPSWTRDGRSLVYASGWEGNIPYPWHAPNAHYLEIWRVDVASRSARTLIDSAGFNFDPDVAR